MVDTFMKLIHTDAFCYEIINTINMYVCHNGPIEVLKISKNELPDPAGSLASYLF